MSQEDWDAEIGDSGAPVLPPFEELEMGFSGRPDSLLSDCSQSITSLGAGEGPNKSQHMQDVFGVGGCFRSKDTNESLNREDQPVRFGSGRSFGNRDLRFVIDSVLGFVRIQSRITPRIV
ncbi:probable ATP-dependent RNA helicase DDX4 [Dromaius novaehollandiae]|uniref:probable ATP-dependent RNA helicase DDX4 n=1 Tax=Dromaius novaehollandiae TaxID=8790 RepID=UPI00311DC2B2